MVFLIQNTQNRDNVALHIKLDEFLRVTQGAQDRLLYLENLDTSELKALRKKYEEIGKEASALKRRDLEAEEKTEQA